MSSSSSSLSLRHSGRTIWIYIQILDCNFAPCHHNNITTLNTCKPIIRRCAKPGDLVIGLLGKELNKEVHTSATSKKHKKSALIGVHKEYDIIYAAIVETKYTMEEYARLYPNRPDSIYEYKDSTPRLKVGHGFAYMRSGVSKTDMGGKYCLKYGKVWRFSRQGCPFVNVIKFSGLESRLFHNSKYDNWVDFLRSFKRGHRKISNASSADINMIESYCRYRVQKNQLDYQLAIMNSLKRRRPVDSESEEDRIKKAIRLSLMDQ